MLGALVAQFAGTISSVIGATDKPYKVMEELIGRCVASRISTPVASGMSIDEEIVFVLFVLLNLGL